MSRLNNIASTWEFGTYYPHKRTDSPDPSLLVYAKVYVDKDLDQIRHLAPFDTSAMAFNP